MKWSIPQLRKLRKPFNFESTFDLNNFIGDMSDVIRTTQCLVDGVCREIGDDTYEFTINLQTTLIMECAVTLEEIEYQFQTEFSETFGYDDDFSSLVNPIVKDTIDLTDVILSEIIVSKPLKVVKEGYEEYYSDEPERTSPFEGLKEFIGGEDK